MARDVYRKIIEYVLKTSELAKSVGIPNILQPGLVKEMIVADILNQKLIISKRNADACDSQDSSILYEYLSCKEGGSGQLDRMFKTPSDKRAESLHRIKRNKKIYLAVFYTTNQMKVKVIYELEPTIVIEETERQLDASRNNISHVGFSEKWARENGKVVYQDEES